MKFPIGIQSFEKLRKGNFAYVDKTALVYKMAQDSSCYFLSRPRRFGKSLLISTLEAYFKGKRELFEGLAIEKLETEWEEHPVLHLDLNTERYSTTEELENILDTNLRRWEAEYHTQETNNPSLPLRFLEVIRVAKQKTGYRVVVLIDEYDKPILQAIGNEPLQEEFRNILKAFYGVLKSADADLRFTLLTGVTKLGKVSVFSDLNNLKDISMSPHYHEICGITEAELHHNFDAEVAQLADQNKQTKEEAYEELRNRYDGYHFTENADGIYNPFSLLWTLSDSRYGNYWFSTGTPTYLVELLKKTAFNLSRLSGYETSGAALESIQNADINPIPVLFQSGYLTIKGYDEELQLYRLDYPNEEVEQGFANSLMPMYTAIPEYDSPSFIGQFIREVRTGKVDEFMRRLQSLMAGTPYELIRELENHYQNVIYIITKLMGFYIEAEYRTSNGRIDLLIGTHQYVYIIELKFDGSAEEALAQIGNKEYALPFATDGRSLLKIGANISRETRNIERWVMTKD